MIIFYYDNKKLGVIMKTNDIKEYIPIVKFLAKTLGPNTEVVLHDLTNYDNSIIAIENGHISGRKVGGPVTDLVLQIAKSKRYKTEDYITNYTGKSKEGKLLKSSTFFIKNFDDELVGMLCINVDVSMFIDIDKKIRQIINYDLDENVIENISIKKNGKETIVENFGENLEDITVSSIESVIDEMNIPPERMSPDEKMDIVKKLNDKGVFLIKGEVSRVAEYLKVSDATVYRYLNKIK
jgi:predicted transcriptional regulator YheO